MKCSENSWLTILIVGSFCAAGLTLSASVQAAPGDGVQSAEGWTVRPAISLLGKYDDNLYREAGQEGEPRIDAGSATLRPSFEVSTPETSNFRLEVDTALQWEQYFGEEVDGINPADQSGLSAHADVLAQLNSKGHVSLTLENDFERFNVPPNSPGAEPFNWIRNRAGGTVGIHPGARILTAELGAGWSGFFYDHPQLDRLDRDEFDFDFEGQWRFLPKTALLLNADYRLIRWNDSVRVEDPRIGTLNNVDADHGRVRGGLTGLLTNRIALRAVAGYGWTAHDVGPDFSGVIGTAAISYTFGRLDLENTLRLGYERDFGNATVGNFYTSHEVFSEYEQGLWDRLVSLYLGARFQMRDYTFNTDFTESAPGAGPDSLTDEILAGRAGVRTNIDDWWSVDLRYSLRANFTDDVFEVEAIDPEDPTELVLRDYMQHVVTLSTTFQY